MTQKLLTGPHHARLEEQAFQQADEIADDSLGSILYITRNDARRSAVEDRWAKSYKSLRLRAETLDAVVRDWYEDLHGPTQKLPGQLNRRLAEYALDKTTTDTEGALAGEPASATLADAFSSRFSLFDEAGISTPEDLADVFSEGDLDERIVTSTVDAYHHYRELRHNHTNEWINTRGELFDSVATAERSVADLSPEVDVIILSGYHEFRPIEQNLIEQLVQDLPMIAILPLHQNGHTGVDTVATDALEVYESLGFENQEFAAKGEPSETFAAITNALYQPSADDVAVPDTLRWRELPTPEREIRFVARELRTELANGTDPDDLAVVIPGGEAYSGYVDDTFDTFEIPHVTTATSQLDRTFAGSVIHDLFGLAESTPRKEDLTSLLANPLVDLVDPDQSTAITSAARRRDTVALEPLLEDIDTATQTHIDELLSRLEMLRTGDITNATDVLRQLIEEQFDLEAAVEDYASGAEQAVEQQAYEVVDEVLKSFETLDAVSSDLSPLALFTRAFDGIPVRVPHGTAGGHIEILGMLDARMRSFEKVFVVGLTSEHFPTRPERPAFFEEMSEAHPRFDTADDLLRGRYLFATMLANAADITLTTPETGSDESAVVQSPILDELQRVTGIEPIEGVDNRIGSREDLQRHIAASHDRQAAVSHAGDHGDFSPKQTIRADRGLMCASNRNSTDLSQDNTGFTGHDGILAAETVDVVYPPAQREPYSASRIERYVECGFKFFAENILEIEDFSDVETTPTPLEAGSYVHDVLERFYADLQDGSDGGVDLSSYDPDDLEQHLLNTALEEITDTEFEYEGLFYDRWLVELFAGLGDPEENPYTRSHRPHDAPERGLFASFLDEELSRQRSDQPRWFESPFGEGLPDSDSGPFEIERPDGSTVSIRGYIDRIDLNNDGDSPQVTLYDYKTGRTPSMTSTTGGTKFQLPLYLLAAGETVGYELFEKADLSATYYQVRPPNNIHVPWGIESKFDSQDELRQFIDEIVPKRLGAIDEAISNGRFHTTLLSARDASCEYCDFRRACDVRHHRKRDHIDDAQSDTAAYVPLGVQDDTELTEVMSND